MRGFSSSSQDDLTLMTHDVDNDPDNGGKMQTRDQAKSPKNWKVVAAIATASALGLSGLALADSDERADIPDPINLEDRTPMTEVTVATTTSTTLADLGVRVDTVDSASSPFDEQATPLVTLVDPPDSVASAASPELAPAPAAVDSVDSGDSADTGSSVESVDDSANS
jgi:hypothetical protein